MDRTAVFIDAGYLFATGSRLLTGERLPRSELHLDHEAMLGFLKGLAGELSGLPLLRIYWYDGAASGPSPEQLALSYRPNLKLRLGLVNQHGQQKGVDSLIVTDLINLARNRAIAEAVLMTGDEDLRVAVQQAQELGVRVHLVGIGPARESQSAVLVQEADSVRELGEADVRSFLRRATVGAAAPLLAGAPTPPPEEASVALVAIARRMAESLSHDERQATLQASATGSLPPPIDRRLLVAGSSALSGAPLQAAQKRELRAAFLEGCRAAAEADPA